MAYMLKAIIKHCKPMGAAHQGEIAQDMFTNVCQNRNPAKKNIAAYSEDGPIKRRCRPKLPTLFFGQ